MLRSAAVAWLLFALAAAIPSSAVVAVALRAASAESARVREEQARERVRAADQAKRDVEVAVTRAKETLRALSPDATAAALSDTLGASRAPFADVVVADGSGGLIVPASPLPEPPDTQACIEARDKLTGPERMAAREHILASCRHLRAASGRHLWPLLALEERATTQNVATWLEENVDRLSPAERDVLKSRAGALGAPEHERALAALERTASLHGTLAPLVIDTSGDDELEDGVRVHRGRCISVLRTMASGVRAGYVFHEGSVVRGLSLPDGLVAVMTPKSSLPAAEDLALTPQLILRIAARDPKKAAAAANSSGDRIVGATVASVVVSALLAGALFWRARRAQRLAELRTDFVAAVSHELRTPLASMRMLAELLERGDVRADERGEIETTLAAEARRLGGTLERMLRFGALARGRLAVDPKPVMIEAMLAKAAERLSTAHPGVRVVIVADAGLEADADVALLGLAIDNLLSNAAKYAPDGHPYQLSAHRQGSHIEIAVADRGPGIARRAQGRVFLPFERADDRLSRATEGTGVGLALVRGIARAHGGDASVRSAPGEGATFVIRFPARSRGGPS
jgi:signal transduction histidine kinase